MLLPEMDISGANVTHYMDNNRINHFEIRKDKCIGFGRTYELAIKDLNDKIKNNDKIIKKTLSKSPEKKLKNGIA